MHTYSFKPETTLHPLLKKLGALGYSTKRRPAAERSYTYHDTQYGTFFKKGYRLRYCTDTGSWELLGPKQRITAAAGEESDPRTAGPIGSKIKSLLAGKRPLACLAARVLQTPCEVSTPARVRITMVFEEWVYAHPRHEEWTEASDPVLTVMEEGGSNELPYLKTLLQDLCAVVPISYDPLESGLEATGSPLPGAPVPGEFSITAEDSIYEAGRKILGRQRYKMWANTEGTVSDLDPEYLHDLRVATRRARFALKLCRRFIDESYRSEMTGELKWIASALGGVRDIDIFTEKIETHFKRAETEREVASLIRGVFRHRRAGKFDVLKNALNSGRYGDILDRLLLVQKREGSGPPDSPAIDVAPEVIRQALKKIDTTGKKKPGSFSEADLHRLRIALKGLRYTCEFFRDFYGEGMRNVIKAIVGMQDCLGLFQDSRVAAAYLGEVLSDPVGRQAADSRAFLALGALIQVQREISARKRAEFSDLFSGFETIREDIEVRLLRNRTRTAPERDRRITGRVDENHRDL